MNKIKQRVATHKARLAKAKKKHSNDFYYGQWQSSIRKRKKALGRWR